MDNIYDVENMSDEEAETKARALGWRPREEFNGDDDKYTDAKTFLDKANTNVPMLRENARKIEQKNQRLEEQIRSMEEKLQILTRRADEAEKAGHDRAIREIEARQRKAVADGDVDEYDSLQKQKESLSVRQAPQMRPEQPTNQLSTSEQIAIQVFEQANPWFRQDEDLNEDMSGFILGIKSKHPDMPLSEVLERAKEKTIRANPDKFSTKANSVLSTGGTGGRMSYASIPAADKANFDRELERNIRDLEIRGVAKEKIEQFKKDYQKNCLEMYK